MAEQYTPNLGHTPPADARRDCIHIAVAPVRAAHSLPPGHHVGIDKNGKAYAPNCDRRSEETVGIVDPFLDCWVDPDEMCWVFLYPGTITSLRHVWSHPAFAVQVPGTSKE